MPQKQLLKTISVLLIFFSLIFEVNAQNCPNIQVIDLRGVPNFGQTDDLAVCGMSDSLAFLIYTDDPGDISNMKMTLHMEDGMEYAGGESTHYGGGTTIVNVDPISNDPEFLLSGVTGGDVFVAYIDVKATCGIDLENDYFVNMDFEYTFTDTLNNSFICSTNVSVDEKYNNSFSIPVLNIQSLTPIDAVITNLGTPVCQDVIISQDGLDTYLDSLDFGVDGIDFASGIAISSLKLNTVDLPYTVIGNEILASVDNSYFSTNGNPSPADDFLNTDEFLTVEICYDVVACPNGITDFPILYKTSYGCSDVCQVTTKSSFIRINPSSALEPTATVNLVNGVTVCGTEGQIDLVVTNPNANIDQFDINDLIVGFNTCEKSNLNLSDVKVGAVSLDPSMYSWVGTDILIDFTTLTSDPDIGSGLVDSDGDGNFDDLLGGESLLVSIFLEIECSVDNGGCAKIDCGFSQFFVEGLTNCGNDFKAFPSVSGSDLKYTAAADTTNLLADPANVVGVTPMYDFGKYGHTYGAQTRELEYCYTFGSENITSCSAAASTYLIIDFIGDTLTINDLDFVSGSAEFDNGTGTYAPVLDTDLSWDSIGFGERVLKIDVGNPAAGTEICYKVTVELDNSSCSPRQYWSGNFKIIEDCPDCTGGCQIVRTCRQELFSADPESTGCPCMFEQTEWSYLRKNLGYTDKTMTTKVTKAYKLANSPADLTRFMPGDTIAGEEKYVIHDMAFFTDLAWWSWQHWSTGSNLSIDSGDGELLMDGKNSKLLEFSIIKNGTTTKIPIDLTTIPSCVRQLNNQPFYYRSPVTNYFGDAPMIGNAEQSYKPGMSSQTDNDAGCLLYNYYDSRDNAYFGFIIYNGDRYYNDCRGMVGTDIADNTNCLDDFLSTYGVSAQDTFYFNWEVPVIKNPAIMARLVEEANGTLNPALSPVTQDHVIGVKMSSVAYTLDENATYCAAYLASACGESPLLETTIPGDITGKSEVVIDDCGGSAEHTFTFDAVVPNGWFLDEFRPLANIKDVKVPIYKPASFCGNAMITDINNVTSAIAIDDFTNLECVESGSEQYCAVESGDFGNVSFDFINSNVTAFGVGLGMTQDSIKLTYDLCMLCSDVSSISGYEMTYDWKYVGDEPTTCGYIGNSINTATRNPTLYPDRYIRVDGSGNPITGNWVEALLPDGIHTTRDTSTDVIIDDQRNGVSALAASNLTGTNLIASSAPTSSVEFIDLELCALVAPPGGISGATGVRANLRIPQSVNLASVTDDLNSPYTFSLLETDTFGISTYTVDLPDVAEGTCKTVRVGTTLLYCPASTEEVPTICSNFTSGCAPSGVLSALAGKGEVCTGTEICYSYIVGEVGLQTSWTLPLGTDPNPELCDEVAYGFLIKNVKVLTLLNLNVNVDIPEGLDVISGSWEYSFAAGLNTVWNSISDPDLISGNHYEYTDDTWNTDINLNGLKGVSSSLDSNKVAFRFKATTACDEFLSGAILLTETLASDPCGVGTVTSGEVQSPPVIIQGAEPSLNAQLLTFSNPKIAYCGAGVNEFSVSALNISNYPTADSVTVCLTLPSELTYDPGSVIFTNPNYVPSTIATTSVGTETQICFDAPKLVVGEMMAFKFGATQDPSLSCGTLDVGLDIKSFVDNISCTTGGSCGVNVQNSLNPTLVLELGPPIETLNASFTEECSNSIGTKNVCYELDLFNPGMTYNGTIHVGFFDDISGNGILDDFDSEIVGNDHVVSVNGLDSFTISMCLDVPEDKVCNLILKQTFGSSCGCDIYQETVDEISPAFFDVLEEVTTICPGEDFTFTTCSETTAAQFELIPDEGTISMTGSDITVHLNVGVAVDSPVRLKYTSNLGSCSDDYTIKLYQPNAIVLGPYASTDVCKTGCTTLDLDLASELQNATISWSPTTYLDDPTIEKPTVCYAASDITYTATVSLGGGVCSESQTYAIKAIDCDPTLVLNLVAAGMCDIETDTFPLAVTLTYSNASIGDSIEITLSSGASQRFAVASNAGSEVFNLSGLLSDASANVDVTAAYVDFPLITDSMVDAFTSPVDCMPVLTIDSTTPSVCSSVDNTYSVDVELTFANAPTGDITITTDNGASQTFTPTSTDGTETFTLVGLTGDGQADIDVTATYVTDGTLTATSVDAYDAPMDCTPSVNINSTVVSLCNESDNTYTVDVEITYVNAPDVDLIITTDNGHTETFWSAGTDGTETFTLTGLISDGIENIDVTVTYVFSGTLFTTEIDAYSAPEACFENCPNICLPIVIQKN